MKMFIIFLGLYAVLQPLVSGLTSYLAKNLNSSDSGNSALEDDESHETDLGSSDYFLASASFSSSLMGTDDISMDSSCDINPANGLPMMGCIDIEGNAYGTDSSHWDDTFSTDSSSMFDDDTFSSSSISSFDD